MAEPQNEQDAQTLFVRGITDEVDEEILFELFQNVSTLISKRFNDKITVIYRLDLFSNEMIVRDAMIKNGNIIP